MSKCPDRFTRGHANCDRCDEEAIEALGWEAVMRVVGLARANAALARVMGT